jgi:adenosine deaminase
LPKIELHLHLDCSLSYAAVAQINPQISAAEYWQEYVAPDKCTSLADFLVRAPKSVALLQTERALRIAVRDLFEQLARDRVIYAEIRYAPLLHCDGGLNPAQVVQIVEAETSACCQQSGIEAQLILCTLRHFSAAQSLHTAELALQFRGSRVTAIDIAGDETLPLTPHIAAFAYAHTHQIACTAHGGEAREAAGVASAREVIEQLRPSRIGHGVRSSEDPKLVQELIQHGIHLEVCPSCNVQIDLYPTYAEHPINRLYRAGVSLNLNTDTRGIGNVTLTAEYSRMQQIFGWTQADFLATNRMAIQAAFTTESRKAVLLERLAKMLT